MIGVGDTEEDLVLLHMVLYILENTNIVNIKQIHKILFLSEIESLSTRGSSYFCDINFIKKGNFVISEALQNRVDDIRNNVVRDYISIDYRKNISIDGDLLVIKGKYDSDEVPGMLIKSIDNIINNSSNLDNFKEFKSYIMAQDGEAIDRLMLAKECGVTNYNGWII